MSDIPPSSRNLSSFTVKKGIFGSMCLNGFIFNMLLEKKIKMDENLYVHESWELLMSLCSENVHTNLIKLPGNIIMVAK